MYYGVHAVLLPQRISFGPSTFVVRYAIGSGVVVTNATLVASSSTTHSFNFHQVRARD